MNGVRCGSRGRSLTTDATAVPGSFFLEDDADVAVALGVGGFDFVQVVDEGVQAEIFLQIIFAQVVSAHAGFDYFAVAHDEIAGALHKVAEFVGTTGREGEGAMERDEHQAAAECGPQRGGAVYRAREHGGEDEAEDGVKGGFLRKETFIAQTHHDEGGGENDDSSQGNLEESQAFRLQADPQEGIE